MGWEYVLALCILFFLVGNFVALLEITKFLRDISAELRRNDEKYEFEPLRMFDFSNDKEKKAQNRVKKPTDRAEQWIKAREIASRR